MRARQSKKIEPRCPSKSCVRLCFRVTSFFSHAETFRLCRYCGGIRNNGGDPYEDEPPYCVCVWSRWRPSWNVYEPGRISVTRSGIRYVHNSRRAGGAENGRRCIASTGCDSCRRPGRSVWKHYEFLALPRLSPTFGKGDEKARFAEGVLFGVKVTSVERRSLVCVPRHPWPPTASRVGSRPEYVPRRGVQIRSPQDGFSDLRVSPPPHARRP